MPDHFDVIFIGTGAGAGTLAHTLAAECELSTAHTGGDLSLPDSVREAIQPSPLANVPAPAETAHHQ